MNAQDLKNSILQLAIQGKLVKQREKEGTAKELLERIEAEKKQLIKEGKIKKEKPLSKIREDEVPFDVPESWEWVRLSEIIDVRDGTHDTPKYVIEGVPLVTSKNLKNGEIDFENVKLISVEDSEKINGRSGVDDGDILFAMIGSIGNPVLVKKYRDFSIKNMALFKPINSSLFSMEYLLNFLQLEQEFMKKKASGGVQSFVSLSFLRSYLVPIPPLAEQKRIVAKIEELMTYVDKYDKAYSEVEELNKKFPVDMQKSILQYAIQGKLVKQREEDGTAEELYNQIQEEKKKLIKEGKIKKTKALPEITEDEIPFDIPESWKWVRVSEVIHLTSGQDMPPNKYNDISNGIPYLTGASNIQDGEIIINRWTPEPKAIAFKGDVLLSCKGTVGKTVILEVDEVHIARQIMSIRTIITDAKFIQCFVKSYVSILKSKAKSMIPGIERKDVLEALLPLPPLEEQKRIVEKIEKLLPYVKQLMK